jgi:hypothetical protein
MTSAAKAALQLRHLWHGLSRALKQNPVFQQPLKPGLLRAPDAGIEEGG